MKSRFSSLDIACILKELQAVIGMRVNQIYDIDAKTYLLKLHASERKAVILFESGARIHRTTFDWPKNDHPSGFSMKLRKHLRNKRLEKISQLGQDRIIDMTFGSGEAAYHIFLELFDKGNVILTDHTLNIVYVLRPHSEKDLKFQAKEFYPLERCKPVREYSSDMLVSALKEAKDGELLKKILIPFVDFGPSVVDHILMLSKFQKGEKVKESLSSEQIDNIISTTNGVMVSTKNLLSEPSKGYIIQKKETKAGGDVLLANLDFQPYLFEQFSKDPFLEYEDFNTAVDEYFSKLGSQKIDLKALQEEKNALKKVEKIRLDQESRLKDLDKKQTVDATKAELIMYNVDLVEAAIKAVRTALAAQMSWSDIADQVSEAQALHDPIASMIKKLKLETNQITLYLTHSFHDDEAEVGALVDVDLDLSAYANVKKYHTDKKQALSKQKKTLQAQGKVLKEAEKKVEFVLKEIQTNATITKQRTIFWFEKFLWFVSSENYLVIGSRDKIQTELIIKRYLKPGDIFVHSDIPAGSCFVVKNVGAGECPPKTLNEAGTMAVCFSSVWEAHILASAWWARAEQIQHSDRPDVSYIVTGNKFYLPPAVLAVGFGFIFYVDEESIPRHGNERIIKNIETSDELKEAEEVSGLPSLAAISLDDDNDFNDAESTENESDKPEFEEIDRVEGVEEMMGTKTAEAEESDFDRDENKSEDAEQGEIEEKPLNHEIDESGDEQGENDLSEQRNGIEDYQLGKDLDMSNIEENTSDREKHNYNEKSEKGKQKAKGKTVKPEPQKVDSNAPKRGQHGKLKKMRDKYKDQDEEEKMARMAILQSAGTGKESSKKKGKKGDKNKIAEVKKPPPQKKVVHKNPSEVVEPLMQEVDDHEIQVNMNLEMLPRLTGIPHADDTILFAMPVVAPYSTLMPYKFRLKVIPGTAKRGKSAKQALNIFLQSKEINEHEKAVMKNVSDQTLGRDLPGKIKLSVGQQANKLKRKK